MYNALIALREGGRFVLRVEDTDRERSRSDYERGQIKDLRWLGLTWEGPGGLEGECGPYRQSERSAVYEAYFERLASGCWTYPCFCSTEDLERARQRQRARGEPPRYPGTCARLDPEEAKARLAAGEPATVRFRVPDQRSIGFDDLVRGWQQFAAEDIGDFVIRRTDGSPAFFFSNAVDDAVMGITHVLRGDDHLANTPRQLLLLEALELPAPRYGHMAMLVDESGQPLSKRRGDLTLQSLVSRGVLPQALTNYLARLGHPLEAKGLLDLEALAYSFDESRLSRAAARVDPAQLRYWQREAVTSLDNAALVEWLKPHLDPIPAAQHSAVAEWLRPNVLAPADAEPWVALLTGVSPEPDEAAREALAAAPGTLFTAAQEAIGQFPSDYDGFVATLREATGLSGRRLFRPLRAALTGRVQGPELKTLYELTPENRLQARLHDASKLANAGEASQAGPDKTC